MGSMTGQSRRVGSASWVGRVGSDVCRRQADMTGRTDSGWRLDSHSSLLPVHTLLLTQQFVAGAYFVVKNSSEHCSESCC